MPLIPSVSSAGTWGSIGGTLADQTDLVAALAALLPTGAEIDYAVNSAPAGWVRKNGGSIGSASSGATERANADTADLYALLWNNYANAQCAVAGGRGASAGADFAANKALTLPDARERVTVPMKAGGSFATLGGSLGAETHTLVEAEMPEHDHTVTDPGHTHGVDAPSGTETVSTDNAYLYVANQPTSISTASATTGISIDNAGSGTAHNNIQPSLVTGCRIIKL